MILPSNLARNGLKLLPRELNVMTLDKPHQHLNIYTLSIVLINIRNNLIKLKSILFHKLFSQLLNRSVVFYLLLEDLSELSFAIIAKQFISWHQSTAYP